ncbi:hypothetical protein HK097_004306 [Rhizophlyctis rosea]|uniref:Uncharacterized protein n=1 Tax=Rhizophlyctis rosea TaxID=64517 RepID=A0AAD5X773_9FUNG|nr:hypothetical protein HK097_004306 [Rhizophlyctis rosea]
MFDSDLVLNTETQTRQPYCRMADDPRVEQNVQSQTTADVSVTNTAENARAVEELNTNKLSPTELQNDQNPSELATEVTPPVPTDEHRTTLQAATIDTFSPSVASTVLSTEHHEDEPQPGAPNTRSTQPTVNTASNHGPEPTEIEGENDPDMVLAQLLSMGFDVEVCEVAIAECVADREGAVGQSLLETSIRWIISRQGEDGPRGIQYSPAPSPKQSRPPPPDARPAKSILKVGQSPPVTRSQSLFKREWLSAKVDQAAEALGATFSKLRSSTTSSPWDSTESIPPGPSTETNTVQSTNASSPFVISGSSDSLNALGNNQPSNPSLSKLPKHVRFSFPDLTIDLEPDFTPDPEELAVPSPPGTPPSEDQNSVSEKDKQFQKVQQQRPAEDEPGWVAEKVTVTNAEERVPDLSAEDVRNYYHQTCEKKGEAIIPKLDAQMKNAAETSGVLTKIDLSGVSLDRRSAATLADVLIVDFGLQHLNLEGCGLDDESLKAILHSILSCDTLPWLSLANNKKLKMNGIKYISVYVKKSKALRYLDLSGIILERRGLAYLGHALAQGSMVPPSGAVLESLRMDSCRLKAPSLELIAPGVRRSRLKHLSLRNNRFAPDCGPALAEMIRKEGGQDKRTRNRLETLDLRGNHLQNGIAYVAKALERNRKLKNLSLRDNKLDSIALCSLAEALRSNRGLQVLDLSGNMMSGENDMNGVMTLKDALSINRTLRELSVANTNLSSEATIALAEALPLTTTLQRLHLAYNPLGLAGAMALSVSLKMNQSITSLEIAPSLGKTTGYEEDEELARLMNDIVIYCQRNAAILKAQEEDDRVVAAAAGSSGLPKRGEDDDEDDEDEAPAKHVRGASPPPPPQLVTDPRTLNKDMERAVDTASLMIQMIDAGTVDANKEVLQQLYEDTKAFQVQLHQLVNNNIGLEEELLGIVAAVHERMSLRCQELTRIAGSVLSVNDVLDNAVKRYELIKLAAPPPQLDIPPQASTSSPTHASTSAPPPLTPIATSETPPKPMEKNDSMGSLLDGLDSADGREVMDTDVAQLTGDEFMAELDDQMKEIDDFLNATASPTKAPPPAS